MLDNGADPNIANLNGFSAIHTLIQNANYCRPEQVYKEIRLLLAPRVSPTTMVRADPNLLISGGDLQGFSPVHQALARRCHFSVFEALSKGGANFNQLHPTVGTPLAYADFLTNPSIDPTIRRFIWEHGHEFQEMKHLASIALYRPLDMYTRSKILEESGYRRRPPPAP